MQQCGAKQHQVSTSRLPQAVSTIVHSRAAYVGYAAWNHIQRHRLVPTARRHQPGGARWLPEAAACFVRDHHGIGARAVRVPCGHTGDKQLSDSMGARPLKAAAGPAERRSSCRDVRKWKKGHVRSGATANTTRLGVRASCPCLHVTLACATAIPELNSHFKVLHDGRKCGPVLGRLRVRNGRRFDQRAGIHLRTCICGYCNPIIAGGGCR